MNIYIPYFIIIHPKKGVWAKNGYKFNSREAAQAELDAQDALHGGANGWAIEEQGSWSKDKKKNDDDW